MNPINYIFKKLSTRARAKRNSIFIKHFTITSETKILDLGSENGSLINSILKDTLANPKNVYIADIEEKLIQEGKKLYGYNPVLIDENGGIDFEDDYFDIVFCSSVLEHVTISKNEVWLQKNENEFNIKAYQRQQVFTDEIKRLGKGFFVQTPYKYFPIESHTWLPFMSLIPRNFLIPILKITNKIWVKSTTPDWHLLDKTQMKQLFSDCILHEEIIFGFTKSLIAIKSQSKE